MKPTREPCAKCGQVHLWCTAHRKSDGGPCGRRPKAGTNVCRGCGGASPQVKAAVIRREQERKAREAMETFGLPVEVDPAEALLQEVHRTAGHVAWLADQVRALDPGALVWGVTKTQQGSGPQGPVDLTEEQAAPPIWLELYTRERAHLVKVCAAALSAGVEERRVRLAEQQGALLASVIRAVLDDLGLSAEQQARVAEVVPRHLRSVTG